MKAWKLAGASALIAVSVAACSSDKPGGSQTGGDTASASPTMKPTQTPPKEVTLKIGLPGSFDVTSKKIIDGFQAKYPYIKLDIEEAPWKDFGKKIVTEIAGNNPPDIWVQENAVILGYGKQGVAENLEPYIKRDLGDKADAAEVAKAEAAKEKVKKALEGDDVDAIRAATEELTEVVQQLSVKMYEQMAQQQQAGQGAEGAGAADGGAKAKDNVVDADYEVVDDQKK